MRFMLASSVPWYLPVLFLSCLAWAFAFYLEGAFHHRTVVRRFYRWTPPLMVGGLLVSRALDVFSGTLSNPEVAYALGQNPSTSEQLRLMFTGQGALEGALLAFLTFALFSPSLPSLRGCSSNTLDFVRSRMMTHAGVWALLLLMFFFHQDTYSPATVVPPSPTVEVAEWSTFLLVVLFTLLLMMSGEILTASAHMASSGETSLLFQRAILKTLVAGFAAWFCLFQTDIYTATWWDRPFQNERLAVALIIATYATWAALPHAFSTVAEGLQGPSSSQAKSLAWCMGLTVALALLITGSTTNAVHLYAQGAGAFVIGWKWVALLVFFGSAAMLLPTVGFDAAHHPEAWWFRATVMMFLPLGVLWSDAAWLLYPAILLAGGIYPLVYMRFIGGQDARTQPLFLVGVFAGIAATLAAFGAQNAVDVLRFSLLALLLVSAVGGFWLRRDQAALLR